MKCIKSLFSIILVACFCPAVAQTDYTTIQTKSGFSGSWTNRQTKLVSLIPNYNDATDGSDDFTRYGTYKYLRTDSTGFFYVKKIDGRWWMVDPDGYAGINMAVTSFTSANIQNDYDITRRLGYNGSGNFLASESQTKSGYNLQNHAKFSFTRRLNFFLNYKNVRKNYYTTPANIQGSLDHILVLDPKFAEYCDQLASTNVTPYADERDLLGWFTDNEINFNQDQLRNLVRDLPAGDPSRNAALAFAASKGLTEADCINYTAAVTEAIKQEFATLLADHYYKTVSEAIRKYDTNHLMLGSRLHGRPRAIQGVVDASHQYMDVTSVNFYDRFTPNEQIALETWTNDKPCIIGEFYIKDINVSNTSQSGAGWYVNSQAHRGYFYQNTCLELLKNKSFIGWHYFRFKDDDDGSNKGVVNLSGNEYTDMTQYMEELNKQVYRICDYYDGINRRPQKNTQSNTITVSEDTYIIAGASNNSNFGTAAELEVRDHSTEANRRETYLKFDISTLQSKLPDLKHAELILTCTEEPDAANRSVFASGITDVSWQETSLNGSLRNLNSDWKNGYNRISFQKGIINQGTLNFDVTTWVFDRAEGIVSFKIHDFSRTTSNALKFASKEHSNSSYHPKLVLTFWSETANNKELTGQKEIIFFPNPVNDILHIKSDLFFSIEFYTIDGQILFTSTEKENDVSFLKKGVYLLKLVSDNGMIHVQKFLKD